MARTSSRGASSNKGGTTSRGGRSWRKGSSSGSSGGSSSSGKESIAQTYARGQAVLNANTAGLADPRSAGREAQGRGETVAQTYEKGQRALSGKSVINSSSLQDRGRIDLPEAKITPVGDIAANNVGFTGTDSSLTSTGNQLVQTPDEYKGAEANFSAFQKALGEAQATKTTGADIQRQLEKDTDIKRKRQIENDLSAQLNTIVANRDANVLRVEGQGRGIPEAIIGGQQAQINKEAAIAALPIQAQLAQAQGNVALAEAHINTWGSILMNDANNEYTQRKELLTNAYEFAQGIEFKKIEKLQADNERKYKENQDFIKAKTNALANALGQGAPASVQSAIQAATTAEEVVAATGIYNADVLGREAQISALQTQALQRENIKSQMAERVRAVDERKQRLEQEGAEKEEIAQAQREVDSEKALNIADLATELKTQAGGQAAVGAGFGKFFSDTPIAGTERADFEAKATKLANLLTLDNLKLMSGVLSETDIKILETAGSSLKNFGQTEKAYKEEISNVIAAMDRTIEKNGITAEQAKFYFDVDDETLGEVDSIFNDTDKGTSPFNDTF